MTTLLRMNTPAAGTLDVAELEVIYPGRRGTVYAVNGVSFQVAKGESLGIVGETGCGKSSLARALVGLLPFPGKVSGGQVRLDGIDVLRLKPNELRMVRAASIGFMPQNSFGALNAVVRVDEQFQRVQQLPGGPKAREWKEQSAAMLRDVGIADPARVLKSYPHQLSGGMAQRVMIALTMIRNPQIIIADEPTTGLDVTILRQVMDLLETLREERGASMLLVTHALGVVARYCAKVMVMYAGQAVELGPVSDVFASPRHPYTQALLGAMPKRGQPLAIIPGVVPSLLARPQACVFRDRCQVHDDPRCNSDRPPLIEVAPGHWAATFCSTQPAYSPLRSLSAEAAWTAE